MELKLKYNRARMAILDHIVRFHLEPGDKLPSERDFQEKLPYSLISIRRALRELQTSGIIEKRPSSGTYLAAAIRSEYPLTHVALLRLRRKESEDGPLRNLFWHRMGELFEQRGIALDYRDVLELNDDLVHLLDKCSGILLTDWITPKWVKLLESFKVPLMVMGPNPCPELPSVMYDWESGAYSIVRKFIERGFVRIAMQTGEPEFLPSNEMKSGFVRAMEEAGLPIVKKRIFAKRDGRLMEDVSSFLNANPDAEAMLVENAFFFFQCVWQTSWPSRPLLAWMHEDDSGTFDFPGIDACFGSGIADEGVRVFADHILSGVPLPEKTAVKPVLSFNFNTEIKKHVLNLKQKEQEKVQ